MELSKKRKEGDKGSTGNLKKKLNKDVLEILSIMKGWIATSDNEDYSLSFSEAVMSLFDGTYSDDSQEVIMLHINN